MLDRDQQSNYVARGVILMMTVAGRGELVVQLYCRLSNL